MVSQPTKKKNHDFQVQKYILPTNNLILTYINIFIENIVHKLWLNKLIDVF